MTRNAQPALMAHAVAAWRVIESQGGSLDAVEALAGHSVGEFSALGTPSRVGTPA